MNVDSGQRSVDRGQWMAVGGVSSPLPGGEESEGQGVGYPADVDAAGQEARRRRFSPPPFQGGGREGGPLEKCARLSESALPSGHRPLSTIPYPGRSHLEFCGGSPASPSPGGGARGRRLPSSPLQGGGREGGPAPGSVGAPRQFTDERDRERPRPGRRAPWVNPPPDLPPSRGEERRPRGRREDGAARLPVRPSRAFPNGALTPPPVQGEGVKTESQVRLP